MERECKGSEWPSGPVRMRSPGFGSFVRGFRATIRSSRPKHDDKNSKLDLVSQGIGTLNMIFGVSEIEFSAFVFFTGIHVCVSHHFVATASQSTDLQYSLQSLKMNQAWLLWLTMLASTSNCWTLAFYVIDGRRCSTFLGPVARNGLAYEDVTIGEGRRILPGDIVQCYYKGSYKKSGPFGTSSNSVFDAIQEGEPLTFPVGKGQVIEGWDIGILGKVSILSLTVQTKFSDLAFVG